MTRDRTHTPKQIERHFNENTSAPMEPHVRDIIYSHPKWVKTRMSVYNFAPRHVIADMVERYAKIKTEPPAVIAVPDGHFYDLLDGAHRVAAAKENGEEDIEVFIPADE